MMSKFLNFLTFRKFYKESFKKSGISDSRYRNRGRIDWAKVFQEICQNSLGNQIFFDLRNKIHIRKKIQCLNDGELKILELYGVDGKLKECIFGYTRYGVNCCEIICIHNLSDSEEAEIVIPDHLTFLIETREKCDLEKVVVYNKSTQVLKLIPLGHHWFSMNMNIEILPKFSGCCS
jgi:hypothetical protein